MGFEAKGLQLIIILLVVIRMGLPNTTLNFLYYMHFHRVDFKCKYLTLNFDV